MTTSENSAGVENRPLLEVEGLVKHFDQADGLLDQIFGPPPKVQAVDGVDLTVSEGETLAVVGESGCGKSTLGKTILNVETPTDGIVRYDGDEISSLSERKLRPYRRDMQMIFQDPLASLNPRQTVGNILRAPMEVHDIGDDKEDRTTRARALLERVGLERGHIDRYPHQFSGGQQQRIAVARALSLDPKLLIADEPVSALDVSVQAQILNLLEELQEEFDIAVMLITHDLSVVRHIADRVAVMYLGKLVEEAQPTNCSTTHSTPTPSHCCRRCHGSTRRLGSTAWCSRDRSPPLSTRQAVAGSTRDVRRSSHPKAGRPARRRSGRRSLSGPGC